MLELIELVRASLEDAALGRGDTRRGAPPRAHRAARTGTRAWGVRAVAIYRGGLLDFAPHRAWVIAPAARRPTAAAGESVGRGQPVRAAGAGPRRRLGGALPGTRRRTHLRLGEAFSCPRRDRCASGRGALDQHRLAPGAIVMNAVDCARVGARTRAPTKCSQPGRGADAGGEQPAARAGAGLRPGRGKRRASRQPAASAQPPKGSPG